MSWRRSSATVAAATLLGACGQPSRAPTPAGSDGFAFRHASIELPTDDIDLPPGPHRDAVAANCTACHSAAMIVTQPRLSRAQWQAEVEKMRKVYKAPVDPAAVPGIVTYLTALPGTEPPQQ